MLEGLSLTGRDLLRRLKDQALKEDLRNLGPEDAMASRGQCGIESRETGYVCTKARGHAGRHVAHVGSDMPVHVWSGD